MSSFPKYLDAHKVGELRALEGRARVTYPYDSLTYPRVERFQKDIPLEDLATAYLTADEEYPDCKLVFQQVVGQDDRYAQVARAWEKVPGPVIPGGSRWDRERGPVLTTTQMVAYDAANTSSLAFVATAMEAPDVGTVTQIDYAKFAESTLLQLKVVETFHVPGPVLTSTDLDETTGLEVPVTTQIIHAGAAHPEITSRFHSLSEQAIDSAISRLVTKIYPESVTGITRTDWVPDSMTWPAVWSGIGGTITSVADFLGLRISGERPTQFSRKEVTTFTTTFPDLATIMSGVQQIIPIRLDLRKYGYSIASGRNILCDSITIGGQTFEASSPTASQFVSRLGSTTDFMIWPRRTRQLAGKPGSTEGLWAVTTPYIPYPAARPV